MTALSSLGEELRHHDRDRFVCALFAPAAARESLFAVYAFDREIGRIVESMREPVLARMRLQWWRDALPRIAAASPPRHPIADSVAAAIRGHGLDPRSFDRLLDARDAQIDGPPTDMAALIVHAENTEGVVMDLALKVLGADAASDAGHHVAVAWSLVEAIRALPHQAARRRHGLPVESLRHAGVIIDAMFTGQGGAPLVSVITEIATTAEARLSEARALRHAVPRAAMPALLPATLADVYLTRLNRAGCDRFAPLTQRPGGGRLSLLANAWRGRY